MKQTSDQDFEHLVGLIYEGPLQSIPWQSFLPQLRQAMDAYAVSLVLRPPATGDRGLILNCRRSDDGSDLELADPNDWEASTYRDQFFAIDPFVNLPAGKVVTLQELMPNEELLQSDYYRDYLQPIGVFHILGVDTVEPNGMTARLRIARSRTEAPFNKTQQALCGRLLPHLQRAIQIHARLSRTESERDVYAGAVDQLSVATVILDKQGRVQSTNAVADTILGQRDGIQLVGQRLQITLRADNDVLQEIVHTAIHAQRAGETGLARALRVSRPSGLADLGLVIRPVPASEWSEGQSSPCLVVFISDPGQQDSASEKILGELFQLTPAEANLAMKLARGMSLAEVSLEQHISQHTTRAQLKAIFAKTGANRQAELVRLVLKSVASLG
jgi:DNA-binding CsgD family transcriptional regulator/PAS domain-containing protein